MKKTILIFLISVLALNCTDDKYYGTSYDPLPEMPYDINWYEVADSATNLVLIDKHFIFEDYEPRPRPENWGYFNELSDKTSTANNSYWPQAHCIDVIVDAYLRTGKDYYKDIMAMWFEGVPQLQYGKDTPASTLYNPYSNYYGRWYGIDISEGHENNGWWNPFIDDMEWIVLAQIRMYQATGIQEYLDTAKVIYDYWIITTWDVDENFGGLLWSFHPEKGLPAGKSKNACSNGPGALIAARLYNITKEDKYLEQAKMIYHWERWMLFNPQTGGVNDAVHYGVVGEYKTTYNQGTFLGAAHELYKITGERAYLEEAMKAAEYTITNMTNANGVLPVAIDGDHGLFNGIFVRYLALLANEEGVPVNVRKKYHDHILTQAITIWTKGINKDDPEYGMVFSPNYENPGFGVMGLSYDTSPCTIFEAVNTLKPIN